MWWDREIRAGADFALEIDREIAAARAVVVLWSEASQQSAWVRDEGAFARDCNKLIPICLGDAEPPLGFRQVQSLRLARADERDAMTAELVDVARALVAGAPARVSSPSVEAPRQDAETPGAAARRPKRIGLISAALIGAVALTGLLARALIDARNAAHDQTALSTSAPAHAPEAAQSIAVLPFTDLSETKDQEFFADGMAEEIINLLAQAPNLLVTARTSSFHFKGTHDTVPEIARALGVANILEGSIRRSGNLLRVTAQLIRADTGYHLWSETYERELSDVFKTQTDIADAVTQALRIKLMGGELSRRKGGTQNVEAYELYLKAKSSAHESSVASLDAADAHLERAIAIDPAFGLAWAWRAQVAMAKADNAPSSEARAGYERARGFAKHALELSDEIADAHTALAYIHRTLDWDWPRADAEARRALAIDPTNPDTLQLAALLDLTLGRLDDAETQTRAALARDPLNSYALWTLGKTLYDRARYAEAADVFRKLLEVAPDYTETRHNLAKTLVAQGKGEEALAVVQQDPNEGWRLFVLPIVLQAAGRNAEADEALKAQTAAWEQLGGCAVAATYAYRGDRDLALQWLERCYEQHDIGILWLTSEPLYRGLSDDPRFKALQSKLNLPAGRST